MAVTTIPQYSPILVAKPTVDLEARDSRIRSSSNMEEPIIVRAAATVLDGTFRRNGSLQVITTSNSDHNDYRQLQAGSRRSTDLSAAASEFQRQRASLLASRKMRKTVSSSALYNRTSTMMSDGSCTSSMISANNNGRSQSPLPPGQRSKSSSTAGGILGLPSPCSPAPRERKLAAGSPGGNRGQGFAPPTPGRAPPRFRSSSATRFSDASDCSSSVVPKFGDWDETDPSSADGYTHIFNRVREERHATAANAPPSKTPTTHSRNTNKKHHRRRNSNSNNKSWYHCFTCF